MATQERMLRSDVSLPSSRPVAEQLASLRLPGTLTFRGTSFHDVLAFLRLESVRLDTAEADERRRGVPVWIGEDENYHCTAAQPGESPALDRLVAAVRCHVETVDAPLGEVLRWVADASGLEMQATDAGVFLWLPGALPGGRIKDDTLARLKARIESAKDRLRQSGV